MKAPAFGKMVTAVVKDGQTVELIKKSFHDGKTTIEDRYVCEHINVDDNAHAARIMEETLLEGMQSDDLPLIQFEVTRNKLTGEAKRLTIIKQADGGAQ